MNRFEELLKTLRERAEGDDKLQPLLSQLDAVDAVVGTDRAVVGVRLPYSSDPKTFEDAWASN